MLFWDYKFPIFFLKNKVQNLLDFSYFVQGYNFQHFSSHMLIILNFYFNCIYAKSYILITYT